MKLKKEINADEYLKKADEYLKKAHVSERSPFVNLWEAKKAVKLARKEKVIPCEIRLLEKVVERAWEQEEKFSKLMFNTEIKRDDPVCQGLCRRVKHAISGVFDEVYEIEFKVGKKTHLALVVINDGIKYIVDGTIRQFKKHEGEERTVFRGYEYPLKLVKVKEWNKS